MRVLARVITTLTAQRQPHLLQLQRPRYRTLCRTMSRHSPSASREMPSRNLVEFVIGHADVFGERIALEEAWSGRHYSYSILKRLTSEVAAGLTQQGFGRGATLCLYTANCLENVPLLFGALATGGVVHLMLPLAPVDRVAPQLAHCKAKFLATTADREEQVLIMLNENTTNVDCLIVLGDNRNGSSDVSHEWLQKPGRQRLVFEALLGSEIPWLTLMSQAVGDDLAVYQLSGGTTGMAKTIMTSHKNLVTSQFQVEPVYNLDPDGKETFLAFLPINHSYPINAIYCPALRIGGKIVIMKRFEVEEVLHAVAKYKVSFLHVVPTQIWQILKCPLLHQVDLSSLKEMLSGAMTVNPKTYQEVTTTFRKFNPNFDFRQGYGLTEASGAVTLIPPRSQRRTDRPGSVGIVLADAECRIVSISKPTDRKPDATKDEEMAAGENGELLIRGPQIMMGYLGRPDLTAQALRDGWFRTGDVAYLDEDGYMYVTDRISDIIWCNNEMVLPSTLENVLQTHRSVRECVVVGCPHPKLGEAPIAVVIPDTLDASTEEMMSFVNEHSSIKFGLHRIVFVDNINKTPVGKPQRAALRKEFEKKIQLS